VFPQPIHMAQHPIIARQALDFAPTVALQLLARLVELGLSGVTAIESPPCIQPRQSGFNLMHRLVGVHRLIEERLCLASETPPSRFEATRGLIGRWEFSQAHFTGSKE
jgi:hypothetical protein